MYYVTYCNKREVKLPMSTTLSHKCSPNTAPFLCNTGEWRISLPGRSTSEK